VTASYSRVAGETAGNYAITATLSPAAVLGNYNITNTGANLTIEKYFFDVCTAASVCTGGSNNNNSGIDGRVAINATIPYLGTGTASVTLSPATLAGLDSLNPDTAGGNSRQFKVWIASNLNPSTPLLFWTGEAKSTAGPVPDMFTWSASIPVTLTGAFPPGAYTAYVYGYDGHSLSSLVADNEGYSKPDTANYKYPALTAGFTVAKANQTITFWRPVD